MYRLDALCVCHSQQFSCACEPSIAHIRCDKRNISSISIHVVVRSCPAAPLSKRYRYTVYIYSILHVHIYTYIYIIYFSHRSVRHVTRPDVPQFAKVLFSDSAITHVTLPKKKEEKKMKEKKSSFVTRAGTMPEVDKRNFYEQGRFAINFL